MPEPVQRREPIEEVVDATVVGARPSGPTFDANDLALMRLRVVGKDAQLVELGVAKPLDLAIGVDAEDQDSDTYPPDKGIRFYVITWRTNFACGYGQQQGQWDEGDPEMPPCAKKQYHYTLFVPEYDRIMPILYTANGTAAKVMRQVNTAIARGGIETPYVQAFQMTTKMCSGTPAGAGGAQKSWPCPVVSLTEADPEEVKIAQGLYESMVGSPRTAIGSGSTPTF